jgi:hypothetical protein
MSEKFKGLKIVKTNVMGCNQDRQESQIMWKQRATIGSCGKQRRDVQEPCLPCWVQKPAAAFLLLLMRMYKGSIPHSNQISSVFGVANNNKK